MEQRLGRHFQHKELDVVEGAGGKSEQVLLTMLFRNCSLMLIFLMEADNEGWMPAQHLQCGQQSHIQIHREIRYSS